MCGVSGFIGLSKNPKVTYEIATNLFDYLETRGVDAAGIWATESGKDGSVFYHKEPIKSSEFIKKDFWKNLAKHKIDLLLTHARATSKGNGHASTNSNNHPFVNSDKRIGMVHNGTIDEATALTGRYECTSMTDSEILLRIFESSTTDVQFEGIPENFVKRLGGIQDIWARITEGGMAVAIGERDAASRYLLLFRNQQRPLWLADLRKVLGQVFFFSSPEIWYKAIACSTEAAKTAVRSQKLIEIPSSELWMLNIDEKEPYVGFNNQFFRFKIDVKETGKDEEKGLLAVKEPRDKINVVTEMLEGEKLKEEPKKETIIVPTSTDFSTKHEVNPKLYCQGQWNSQNNNNHKQTYNSCESKSITMGTEHEPICDEIIKLAEDICTTITNACLEGTISPHEFQEVVDGLESTKNDLRGTLKIICG